MTPHLVFGVGRIPYLVARDFNVRPANSSRACLEGRTCQTMIFDAIVLEPERKRLTRLSRATWWRMELAGTAPRRLQLSPRRIGWRRTRNPPVDQYSSQRRMVRVVIHDGATANSSYRRCLHGRSQLRWDALAVAGVIAAFLPPAMVDHELVRFACTLFARVANSRSLTGQ